MKLEVINVKKTFEDVEALKDVSFSIERGNSLGLLGKNGAGKSTIIRLIMNLFYPDKGEILLDNKPLHKMLDNIKIGYLPEERGLYSDVAIGEQMIYFGRLRGLSSNTAKNNAKKILDVVEASDYYQRKPSTLSKGNQQKIQLAIALINDPDILILDEPFSGLDPINSQILKQVVRKSVEDGKLVIFSSHQMSSVEEFCKDICIINKGKVVLKGNLENLRDKYEKNNIKISVDAYYQERLNTYLQNDNMLTYEQDRDNFYLNLSSHEYKNNVLKYILENDISINEFTVIKPTLEQIFIETVGGKESGED